MKKKSLGINAIVNLLRNIVNIIFPIVTFPYASRILGVESLGIYNFSYSVSNYFLLLASLGISTYAVREGAKYRNDHIKMRNFANEVFSINIISTLFAYLCMIIIFLFPIMPSKYIMTISVFSLQLIFTTVGVEWLYTIYEEFTYITIVNIVFKIISVFLLFLFVKSKNDYIAYAAVTVFAIVGSNLFNYIHMKKVLKFHLTFKINLKKHILPILMIFASNVAVAVYVNIDVTMLGFMKGDYAVGIYSVAVKIYNVIKNVLAAILIVSIPRLAMLISEKKQEEFKNLASNIYNIISILLIPAVCGIFLLSKDIVCLVAGNSFYNSTKSLQLLSIALMFAIFSWLFSQCILIPMKQEKIVLVATILSAVINTILNIVLIPIWKENAAALTTIIAELISAVIGARYSWKHLNLKKIYVNIREVIVATIIMVIAIVIVKRIVIPTIATLFISIVVGGCLYFIVLLVLKNKIVTKNLQKILEKIRRKEYV